MRSTRGSGLALGLSLAAAGWIAAPGAGVAPVPPGGTAPGQPVATFIASSAALPARFAPPAPAGTVAPGAAAAAEEKVAAPRPSGTETREALRITGRMELPAGAAPVEAKGAEIELRPAVEDYAAARRRLVGGTPAPPLASALPDGTGAFVLVAPGPGCYRVSIRAAGYLPIDLVLAPLVEDRELPPARLVAATPISGRTVGPQGEPLPGVLLVLQDMGWRSGSGPAAGPAWQPAERSGRTGPDGRLDLPVAASETQALTVFDPRFLGASIAVPEPAAAAGRAGPREAVLRLTPHPALVIEARGREGRPAWSSIAPGAPWPAPASRPSRTATPRGHRALRARQPAARMEGSASPASPREGTTGCPSPRRVSPAPRPWCGCRLPWPGGRPSRRASCWSRGVASWGGW
jgi:hypothetical protein